jgi:predicted ATPase/class 3 adenylate cyclase
VVEPPSGTVTFLFTDIEGSTKLLQRAGELYADLLDDHRVIMRAALRSHGGYEVDTEGDSFFIAFASASAAAAAAAEAQRALAEHSWLDDHQVRVRMGLHTGKPRLVDRAYVGLDVHRAARVMAAGHGGQVVVSQSTRKALGDDWPVLDLGEHRLKDLLQPEHLFQLVVDGLPSRFPALKTLGNRPTNLPTQPNPLVGRELELREIAQLLRAEDIRLLTLTGTGGAGKTRLALQAGAELLEHFRSGVFFVSLAPVAEEDLLVSTIARVLAVRETAGEDLEATLSTYLADKQMLLVLDNFEQIAGAAPTVAQLLAAAPDLCVIVTSRERLRISAEHVYEVPALPESDAIALFVARAQGAAPGFMLSDDNRECVAALCQRLEGLPLSVELAAARSAVLSPRALLERLDERLMILTGGARDAADRHRTLRQTIEWSYDLLDASEQNLFRSLAVFVDGCRLDAAESICLTSGDFSVVDGLQSLVDKSLVRQRSDPDGERRFWMLETIREYATERLVRSGEADLVEGRHTQHFLELADHAEPVLWRQKTDAWLPRLEVEQANFRAALERALSNGENETAFRLGGALYPFWELRARHREARVLLSRILALDNGVSPRHRAKVLIAAGRATSWQFDWLASNALLEEAVAICRKLGDVDGIGRCLGFIGHARLFTGDHEGAATALEEGVELARRSGDARSLARALHNAAFAHVEQRDFVRAREMFGEAIRIARAEQMTVSVALATSQLGHATALAGDYEDAASYLRESAALFAELGDTIWTQNRYQGLLALLEGELDAAESLLMTSLVKGREQAPQQDIPYWIEDVAAVADAKGELVRAATLWGATDALFEKFRLAILEENRQVRERFRRDQQRAGDEAWTEAWARGHAMSLDEAVDYALAESEHLGSN